MKRPLADPMVGEQQTTGERQRPADYNLGEREWSKGEEGRVGREKETERQLPPGEMEERERK